MQQSPKRVNFPKILTVLAITFAIASGLCGMNGFAVSFLARGHNMVATILVIAGSLELLVMILSGVGVLVMLVAWGLAALIRQDARDAG